MFPSIGLVSVDRLGPESQPRIVKARPHATTSERRALEIKHSFLIKKLRVRRSNSNAELSPAALLSVFNEQGNRIP
jgi:hypothetical protein